MNNIGNEIVETREETHGDFGIGSDVTKELYDVLERYGGFNSLSNARKVAFFQICLKIGRIVGGCPDFDDHYDDISGYAQLAKKYK